MATAYNQERETFTIRDSARGLLEQKSDELITDLLMDAYYYEKQVAEVPPKNKKCWSWLCLPSILNN